MKTISLSLLVFIIFSCSKAEQTKENSRQPMTMKEHIKRSVPKEKFSEHGLTIKVQKIEILKSDEWFENGSCLVHLELVNNGPSVFNYLYYSCNNPLKATNPDCQSPEVICNRSYPMYLRLNATEKETGIYQIALKEKEMQTKFCWHVLRSSGDLNVDEFGKVIEGQKYSVVDEYDLYSETITIPAKR